MDRLTRLFHPTPPAALSNRSRPCAGPRVCGTVGTALVATLAALSVTLLGACGGGEFGDEGGTGTAGPTTSPASTGATPVNGTGTPGTTAQGSTVIATTASHVVRKATFDFRLESEYGPGDAPGSMARDVAAGAFDREDASAVPVDRTAQTRRGRYISRAIAERTYEETGGSAVWIDASCCAGLDPELPMRIAFGMQAVLGDEAPLYVGGNDLRQAARLADRLDALGVRRVYLVTP